MIGRTISRVRAWLAGRKWQGRPGTGPTWNTSDQPGQPPAAEWDYKPRRVRNGEVRRPS